MTDLALPPLYLPIDLAYGADELGLPWKDLLREGVVGSGSFAVTQRGAGADKSVDVAAGAGWVQGDDDATAQPIYRARSAATVNLAVAANTSGQPRVDRVVLRIYDATFAGSTSKAALEILQGTPTGGATKENATGAATIPNGAIELARLGLASGYATVTTADILDTRVLYGLDEALAGATPAASVSGLGFAVDGKIGHIRVGASPYDFLELIYDATLGKWVSAVTRLTWPGEASAPAAYAIVSSYLPCAHLKTLYDAGLRLQASFQSSGVNGSGAGARTIGIRVAVGESADLDAAGPAKIGNSTALSRSVPLSSGRMYHAPWTDVAITAPTKEYAYAWLEAQDGVGDAAALIGRQPGAGAALASLIMLRWVSA